MTADTPFRPEARAPRGFADKRARDLAAERRILQAVSAVYERWGFEALDTGAFEYADALGKFLPDSDRPNEGVFALQDDDEQWMALRYDLTAPLARFAAQNWESLPKPFRRYAFGTVWRNEKPGPGRFREFIQCDADTVGSARPQADAEMVAMAAAGFEAAGLPRGAYQLKINNRKLLDGLLAEAGVGDPRQKLVALRAMDKLDRLGWEGARDLLGAGRMDESGAYTKGAGLDAAAVEAIGEFLDISTRDTGVLQALARLKLGAAGEEGLRELELIEDALTGMGVSSDQARFDPAVVRGLEYYTGPVFEAELLLETTGDKGEPVRFGSVGGGGRYDDLVARFTGEQTPATGFSFGVSRLAAALRAAGRDPAVAMRGPVVVIVFDQARMADYFAIAAELRAAGVPAEVYLGSSGMKAQMKYADRRLSPAAIIVGDDELNAGAVTIKDLDLGRELAKGVSDNQAWRAERPGQQTVPRGEMIARVRAILEGQGVITLEPPVPEAALKAMRAPFLEQGATAIETPVLQPLALLLDLAGEAMRPRLFVVQADGIDEAALRPDFTIPVARAHIESGAKSGRYLYEGKAFRVAPQGSGRAEEFLQIGVESFGLGDPALADAAMAGVAWRGGAAGGRADLTLEMGDISLFLLFLEALGLPRPLVTRLDRAFRRPRSLAAELERAQSPEPSAPEPSRLAGLLAGLPEAEAAKALEELWALAGVQPVGGRAPAEIVHRLAEQAEAAKTPALSASDAGKITDFLAVSDRPAKALAAIGKLARAPGLEQALDAWSVRLQAMIEAGAPEGSMRLSPAFGRAFGYYDGFLFEVRSTALDAERPVAAGGRYDGLMTRLSARARTGAVGCMVRPWRAWSEGER